MVLVALVGCALAAVAIAATASDGTFNGPIDKGGRAEIAINSGRLQGTPVRRYRWEFRRLVVRCSGELETARFPVTGGEAINAEFDHQVGERWGVSGTRSEGPDGFFKTRVSGRLVSRRTARGWVRVFGTAVPVRGGGTRRCDSGRLRWLVRARNSERSSR